MGLLSPTCHHVASRPCSLPPLPVNLRQSAEQKTDKLFTLPVPPPPPEDSGLPGSLPSCSASLHQCWVALSHTFANSSPISSHALVHILSHRPPSLASWTTPSSSSFFFFQPPPLRSPSLPSGSWLVKRGWSVARGHKHAHTHSYTARHHQEEMQPRTHSFSLPFLPLSTFSTMSPFCINRRANVTKTCVCEQYNLV